MKKLVLVLALCLFIMGCVGNELKFIKRDPISNKIVEEVDVSNLGGMNNAKTGLVEVDIETPSGFKAILKLKNREVTDSPESMDAIGEAGANIISAGSSGVINNLTK